jgi:C-terminal processing protease CtpA/Prc
MRTKRIWTAAVAALLALAGTAEAQRGDAPRGRMGVYFEWEGRDAREARVADVEGGSPAERAGVRRGDVVVRVNGAPATEEAIDRLRDRLHAGDTVRLRVRRGRAEEERRVVAQADRRAERRVERRPGRGLPDEVVILDRGERVTVRLDSMRVRVDSLARRAEAMRARVRTTERDSVVVLHFDGENGRRGRDSMVVDLRAATRMGRVLARELGDLTITETRRLPFFLELGRRAVAGAELQELNPELARYFRVDDGVLVVDVARNTPAARAGLQGGDVIVRAAGRAVTSVADLRRAFGEQPDGSVRLDVVRQGQRRTLNVEWNGRAERGRSTRAIIERERARN